MGEFMLDVLAWVIFVGGVIDVALLVVLVLMFLLYHAIGIVGRVRNWIKEWNELKPKRKRLTLP